MRYRPSQGVSVANTVAVNWLSSRDCPSWLNWVTFSANMGLALFWWMWPTGRLSNMPVHYAMGWFAFSVWSGLENLRHGIRKSLGQAGGKLAPQESK